jgi:hypothetical protein
MQWKAAPLDPASSWSEPLRKCVATCLGSAVPVLVPLVPKPVETAAIVGAIEQALRRVQ